MKVKSGFKDKQVKHKGDNGKQHTNICQQHSDLEHFQKAASTREKTKTKDSEKTLEHA